ncbi:MAG TPA: hypothetical protein VHB20_05410 [Verrucomicrobiae bacterium]|jgi:hypothetical protein|nr:hypothetical protein [Verrucomicrobiae bacterium]
MLITNLLTNMVVVYMGVIQTNTPQFSRFEFQALFSKAQFAAKTWGLETSLIESNKVTEFWNEPSIDGAHARMVFAGRYAFNEARGRFLGTFDGGFIFADRLFCWPDYSGVQSEPGFNMGKAIQLTQNWLHETNGLTMKAAQDIAESAVHSFNIPIGNLLSNEPCIREQKPWQLNDGTPSLEPYYMFEWKVREGWCKVDVSGISSNVVYFNYSDGVHFRLPTNYFQMLGLSSNSVFVTPSPPRNHRGPPYEIYDLRLP